MIWNWSRSRKRRRYLSMPLPTPWTEYIAEEFVHWSWLSPIEQERLAGLIHAMVRTKHWEGCQGLVLTDPMKALIAAQAGLLLLGTSRTHFGNVNTILVYPGPYVLPGQDGGFHSDQRPPVDRDVQGHASFRGPLVLSWPDVLAGARDAQDGRNLVFHEFAHKLDMLDGWIDGTPPLECRDQQRDWVTAMTPVFNKLQSDLERGRRTFLNPYAATHVAEFFAVATEFFFERPEKFHRIHPKVYRALAEFYKQDPASRAAQHRITQRKKPKNRHKRLPTQS